MPVNQLVVGKRSMIAPNVLRVSCAAPLDRDDCRAETSFQNSHDLARREAASATPHHHGGVTPHERTPPWEEFSGRACWAAAQR